MKVEVRRAGAIPVLSPAGRVTIGEPALALKGALDAAIEEGAVDVILDGSRVHYIDSTGLGELIATARRLSEGCGGRLGIAAPSRKLREILEITGLKAIFVVADSEAMAAEALTSARAATQGHAIQANGSA